ncbi:MAG: hypothetical protein IKK60_05970 [Clostridia bacterium]|nr:hypothetical protein [Clostridia bacterium]
MNNAIIIGGDDRQRELYGILTAQGLKCKYINSSDEAEKINGIKQKDIIILPVPLSKDKENIYSSNKSLSIRINDVLKRTDKTNMIFAGSIPKTLKAYLDEKEITFIDYLDSEETVQYNAYLTGLGAVKLLMENTKEDIRYKKTLVTGFGRVAEFTAQALKNVGCDVYITARNKLRLSKAECMGYKTIDLDKISSFMYLFDYIFNTVPVNIFTAEDVSHIKGRYFELASAPFGADKAFFINRENDYFDGGALPGRYFSRSAAEKLAEITLKHINLRNGGD